MTKKWIIALVLVAVLGIAWYGISPLFRTLKTDEAIPVDSEADMKNEKGGAALMTKEVGGTLVGTAGHPASGTAKLVHANGKDYVRYENLKTINGPDLYVYLSKDLEAKEYVSLGKVKSTEGNSNYEIPSGTAVADYRYVIIWCKQFGVLFNSATLK